MIGAANVVCGVSLGEYHRSRSGRASKKRDGVEQNDGAHDVSILMAAVAVVG